MSNVEQWEHNEQRAMETEITTLREQVEKLTKERDAEIARNRPLQSLIKLTEETKSFLLKKSEENKEAVKQLDSERQANALLTEELADLAEQNEKFRKALSSACDHIELPYEIGERCAYRKPLSLPDLASPVLNRIRAEGMEEAAQFVEDTFDLCGDELMIAERIRARKAELEKSK